MQHHICFFKEDYSIKYRFSRFEGKQYTDSAFSPVLKLTDELLMVTEYNVILWVCIFECIMHFHVYVHYHNCVDMSVHAV